MVPSIQIFSVKGSSSTIVLVKFKALVHALVLSHVCRLTRAISRAVSAVTQSLKQNYHQPSITFKKNKKNKILFGSFRLHYNWCSSSHVMPVPAHFYYDTTVVSADDNAQLSGYLQWLEDGKLAGDSVANDADVDVDKLADMFIASCHEQFRLEKQESYRRFQEMMARSM